MPHRGASHARRRAYLSGRQDIDWGTYSQFNPEHPGLQILPDFDETTYDDVVPHRLRGTVILNEDGDLAALTVPTVDRPLTC